MDLNIDSAIFIGFLIVTIIVGLLSSRGTNTIRQYAVGDRNFSTATLVATIVATWIGGEFFYVNISEAYSNGLNHIWVAVLGDFFAILIVGVIFAPRVGEFLGKLSIADAMGGLYGDRIRVITAAAGFVAASGAIGVELKLSGTIFEYALGISPVIGIILSTFIVTLYSSLGGVKSVTFTDIIQVFTFGVVIPVVAYALLISIDNIGSITTTLTTNPKFNLREVFDFSNPVSFRYLCLFLFFIVPPFGPANFQRIAMASDTGQVRRSFTIAAFTCLFFAMIIGWIAVLTLSINPALDPNDVIKEVLLNSKYIGLKGAILAGIMAMIMSTVDSYINSTSVLVVNDFCKPLKIKLIINEVISARVVSAIIGLSSLCLSLYQGSLLDLIIITCSFYMPIVTVPFIMSILGFRSTEKSVLIGMGAGLTTVILWDYVIASKAVNSVFLGMVANLVFLVGSHYILRQEGGWIGIKDIAPLIAARNERKLWFKKFLQSIKSFDLIEICQKNCPKGEGLVSILGIFVMVSIFGSTHTLAKEYQLKYSYLLGILYPITLCTSAILISYPLWLPKWKESNFIGICWNIIMFAILICFSLLMVLISNFSEIQLMIFMVNIIILSSIISWRWALFTIATGVMITNFIFQNYIYIEPQAHLLSSQFKIIYLLLLIISTLVTFIKPKQEHLKATEDKVDVLAGEVTHLHDEVNGLSEQVNYYSERVADQEKKIKRLGSTAQKILNNVNHELRLPIGNVMNFSDMLNEVVQKSDNKLVKELSQEVYVNSNRVSTMILNMLDLATLDVKKVDLQKSTINFSELVTDRVKSCRKIYMRDKKIDFEFKIEPEILIFVDPNYIRQTIDNLVINAVTFSEKGVIKISVLRRGMQVEFTIIDQGKGIPPKELSDIFTPFQMGSNTESKAEGRGMGLALCKSAIEAHGGTIKAYSDGICGAKLWFNLPLTS